MTTDSRIEELLTGLTEGKIVPYLGPGVLKGVKSQNGQEEIPADSDSLILAMNNGRPMAPKLMYEFPRAAMNLELKKGRSFIERFLVKTYQEQQWQDSPFHQWLAMANAPYVIDTNRDTQLQQFYKDRPHTLVVGLARISGTDYRFKIYNYVDGEYKASTCAPEDLTLPILFKPMGTPMPEPNFIASDADYVDYITELMGGFGMPAFLKLYRQQKQYLFLGMHMTRDTERMVLSDIIYAAGKPAGWALIPEPTDKERRYCKKQNIEIIEADWDILLSGSKSAAESA